MNSDTLHYECCLAVKTKGYKEIVEEVECKLFGLKVEKKDNFFYNVIIKILNILMCNI